MLNLAIGQRYFGRVVYNDIVLQLLISRTQLDALSPAVDILMRDLPCTRTREQSIEVLRTAVEVCITSKMTC